MPAPLFLHPDFRHIHNPLPDLDFIHLFAFHHFTSDLRNSNPISIEFSEISFFPGFNSLFKPKNWVYSAFYLFFWNYGNKINIFRATNRTNIVATRFFLACFLFFLPSVSVSICGIIFYLLFAIFFVRKIIFTNDDDDRLYIETGIKNIICAIFCFNYLVLIPGVEVVNQKFFGFDAFKPEGYSFQV